MVMWMQAVVLRVVKGDVVCVWLLKYNQNTYCHAETKQSNDVAIEYY
jgi:hypothetical protein